MASTSIVSPCSAQDVPEQPNSLENACSHIDIQATDAQVRAAAARARREHDVTLRTTPATIEHIRQLIALECTRVERTSDAVSTPTNGACAKMCGSEYCDTFGCMLDQAPPLEGERTPLACDRSGKSTTCPECGSSNAEEDEDGTITCPDCGYVAVAFRVGGAA